jgi:hypothetical protein
VRDPSAAAADRCLRLSVSVSSRCPSPSDSQNLAHKVLQPGVSVKPNESLKWYWSYRSADQQGNIVDCTTPVNQVSPAHNLKGERDRMSSGCRPALTQPPAFLFLCLQIRPHQVTHEITMKELNAAARSQ